jgi:DNA-binding CsgD family transcriptional regulator
LDGILALAASCAANEPTASAQLLGYVDAERRSWNRRNGPTEQFAFEKGRNDAVHVVGSAAFEQNFALGRGLGVGQVDALIARLRDTAPAAPARPAETSAPIDEAQPPFELSTLSAREWTIATRVAAGMSNAEIADELVLSRRTVETHVATILRKADLRSRAKLAALISSLRGHGATALVPSQRRPARIAMREATSSPAKAMRRA